MDTGRPWTNNRTNNVRRLSQNIRDTRLREGDGHRACSQLIAMVLFRFLAHHYSNHRRLLTLAVKRLLSMLKPHTLYYATYLELLEV